MKSFIVSIILILATVSVTTVCAVVTDEYADRMISAVDDAAQASVENRADEAKEIASVWEEARSTVCITVHRKVVTRTDTLISALTELCKRPHTETEYFGICRQLEEELRQIKELCIPSWCNIM